MTSTENEGASRRETKCCSFETQIGPIRISLNPIVTLLSSLVIWAFVIWCVVRPSQALSVMTSAKSWVTVTSTWFYIGTKSFGWFSSSFCTSRSTATWSWARMMTSQSITISPILRCCSQLESASGFFTSVYQSLSTTTNLGKMETASGQGKKESWPWT